MQRSPLLVLARAGFVPTAAPCVAAAQSIPLLTPPCIVWPAFRSTSSRTSRRAACRSEIAPMLTTDNHVAFAFEKRVSGHAMMFGRDLLERALSGRKVTVERVHPHGQSCSTCDKRTSALRRWRACLGGVRSSLKNCIACGPRRSSNGSLRRLGVSWLAIADWLCATTTLSAGRKETLLPAALLGCAVDAVDRPRRPCGLIWSANRPGTYNLQVHAAGATQHESDQLKEKAPGTPPGRDMRSTPRPPRFPATDRRLTATGSEAAADQESSALYNARLAHKLHGLTSHGS
jgi:hypothetical protein